MNRATNKTLLAVISLGGFLLGQPADADDCTLKRVASVDMTIDSGGGVSVPMTIRGRNVDMLVDTGGYASMVTDSLAKELSLNFLRVSSRVRISMFGGLVIDHYVAVPDIDLGGLKADKLLMLVVPEGRLGNEQGTIAPDILRAYDVEFDFANAKFNLLSQDHCPGKTVYWTKDSYAKVPFTISNGGHIEVPIMVDDQSMRAAFDTGSSTSTMSLETAEKIFHFDEKSPDLKAVNADSSSKDKIYRYPFKSLGFEGVKVNNPDILLFPDNVSRMGSEKLIIGMDVLRQLHLYIAYGEKQLYVTAATAH